MLRKYTMVSLSEKWEKFSLSNHEGNQYLVQEDKIEEGNFLAASFFTNRVLSMEAIARMFKLLWCTRKGFEVRDIGNHRVLFEFKDPSDVDRALKGETWSFDKNLEALKWVSRHTDVRNLDFDGTSFWVQVHNLPIGSFYIGVAKEIVSVVDMVDERETERGTVMLNRRWTRTTIFSQILTQGLTLLWSKV